jgi:hypothetical protein
LRLSNCALAVALAFIASAAHAEQITLLCTGGGTAQGIDVLDNDRSKSTSYTVSKVIDIDTETGMVKLDSKPVRHPQITDDKVEFTYRVFPPVRVSIDRRTGQFSGGGAHGFCQKKESQKVF